LAPDSSLITLDKRGVPMAIDPADDYQCAWIIDKDPSDGGPFLLTALTLSLK